MSLITDVAFVQALRSNTSLLEVLADGDVYNTTIAVPDKDMENADIPYVIVSYDGMVNESDTKDDSYEGGNDRVTVSIEVAAGTRKELGDIITEVRSTVKGFFEDNFGEDGYEEIPLDYTLRASGVMYDPFKPCHYQTLTYECDSEI